MSIVVISRISVVIALWVGATACASTQVTSDMSSVSTLAREDSAIAVGAASLPQMTGGLGQYLAHALKHSPETRAAFERWRSARFRISRAGRLPEPNISFGYFLRSVETRVGPQRYKIGIAQTFPWPGKLGSAEQAAVEKANAAALMTDAYVLAIRRDVARAYWSLWRINEEHRLMSEHDVVLEALAGAVRGRLQTGAASLADLNQIELNIARHHDHFGKHKQAARKASARLRAILGASPGQELLPVTESPVAGLPVLSESQLMAQSRSHPRIARSLRLAASEEERAQSKAADRYPRFKLGLNLIGTGESSMPVADNGKDAVVLSAGLSLPLWAGSYDDSESAALAASSSHRATAEASARELEAMLTGTLANVRDAQRRILLYQNTLVPQAEATFGAVLGGYQSGRGNVASIIIAQRDLIELQIERAKARADHSKAWATLEFVVGTQLDSQQTKETRND